MKKVQKRSRRIKRHPKTSAKVTRNTLRIIGGRWRSRRLPFISVPNLRPTPDRVRETLFNWLQADIAQARCLDLFAGSGALGLEALSRGASELVFVEKNKAAAQRLVLNLECLNASDSVENRDAESYLSSQTQAFDIIFLDPPFRQAILPKILDLIIQHQLLMPEGLIYLEQEAEDILNPNRWGLKCIKATQAGQVKSYLLQL